MSIRRTDPTMLDDAAATRSCQRRERAFVAGGRHGDGVMVVRNGNGGWSAPSSRSHRRRRRFSGGCQSTDVVRVQERDGSKVLNGVHAGREPIVAGLVATAGARIETESCIRVAGGVFAGLRSTDRGREQDANTGTAEGLRPTRPCWSPRRASVRWSEASPYFRDTIKKS
jgi:hypothetical protein